MRNMHSRYRSLHLNIVGAPSRAVAYNIAKQQNIRCIASSLKFLGMEVWNGIWKKTLVWNGIWKKILVWNGRFLVWNGNAMEENCQYGIRKNRLPFHSIPCPDHHTYIFVCKCHVQNLVWNWYGRLSSISFLKSSIPFHSGIFYIPYRNFPFIPSHSIPYHALLVCFTIRLAFNHHLNSYIAYPGRQPEPSNHTGGQFLKLSSYPLRRLL